MNITKTLTGLLVGGACILGAGEKAKSETFFYDDFNNYAGADIVAPWTPVYFDGWQFFTSIPGNITHSFTGNNYFGNSGKSLFVVI
jgi:hypothetical protein